MFEDEIHPEATDLLHRLDHILDELTTMDLDDLTDQQLIAFWGGAEDRRRRFAPLDHVIISQLESRQVAHSLGVKNLTRLGRQVLRISAGEAAARVKAASALGPRRAFTGEPLQPSYPVVAAGQAAGTVSAHAAKVIVDLIEHLPDAVRDEQHTQIETFLVDQAQVLDVDALQVLAQRIIATLDPDGTLTDAKQRDRERDVWVTVRQDGSSTFGGNATAELTEYLRTVLDTLARPKPETDGQKDLRSPGQRRHDGLLSALRLVIRANQLPHCAGTTTTVVLTMTDHALATGEGTATTGHGITLPAKLASSWLGGDTRIIPVKLGRMGGVSEYGSSHRIFTENQRLTMIARDGGCSFPGCDAPPQWTEAHHVIPYKTGGPTSVDNGVLLCGYHHDHHERSGWTCQIIDGVVRWVPPRWKDCEQKPIRNHMHHADITFDVDATRTESRHRGNGAMSSASLPSGKFVPTLMSMRPRSVRRTDERPERRAGAEGSTSCLST